ncbi:MAG: hydrogenase maturation nickel metallochaperone HypA [Oscillatoriales cyanobacterium]|nr:MAG: hydrogenase maturation nickel metallochaperone HypA [Oscillatoriales cyanobacterium]
MHELSLMASILETAEQHARDRGAAKIHRIGVRIGELSGVVPEALEFAFETCTIGTIAEGATFEIERIPAVCYCPRCDREFRPTDWVYVCPSCELPSSDIRQGRDLVVSAIEISSPSVTPSEVS